MMSAKRAPIFSKAEISEFPKMRQALHQWWEKHRREFPWRFSSVPYHVFLAEMLLQKTQASKARKAFERIVAAYPSIEALSNASLAHLEEIIGWLGLTKRAQYLLQASQKLMNEHAGQIPQSLMALKRLPGVGDYSANAILCFAFHQPRPLLDSSISRVLQRIFGYRSGKKSWEDKVGWQVSLEFLDLERPVQHNYSLLDLAALVCTPTKPACSICPVRGWCDYAKQARRL